MHDHKKITIKKMCSKSKNFERKKNVLCLFISKMLSFFFLSEKVTCMIFFGGGGRGLGVGQIKDLVYYPCINISIDIFFHLW